MNVNPENFLKYGEELEILKRMQDEKVIFISEANFLRLLAAEDCEMTLSKNRFNKYNLAFPAYKGFPYLEFFNERLVSALDPEQIYVAWRCTWWPFPLRGTRSTRVVHTCRIRAATATGLINHWVERSLSGSRAECGHAKSTLGNGYTGLSDTKGVFGFLIVGLGVSFVVFCGETVHKLQRRPTISTMTCTPAK